MPSSSRRTTAGSSIGCSATVRGTQKPSLSWHFRKIRKNGGKADPSALLVLNGFACDYRAEGWDVNVLSRGTLMHLDQMKVQEKARRLYSAALAKGNQTKDPKKCGGLE